MNIKNKTAVITGACSGIGLAAAKALISEGVKVYALDLKPIAEKLDNFIFIKTNITKNSDVKKALKKIQGPINILFNNAGVMKRGTILDIAENDFDRLFNIHVKGSWLMLKNAKSKLATNAVIAQMSSRHGLSLASDPGLYSLVKRFSSDLAELLKNTYPGWSIKTIFPGPVDTALSRTECSPAQWQKKEHLVFAPDVLAEQIVRLLQSDTKTKLIFDEKRCKYLFK